MAAKEISVKKYVVRLSGEERERLETLIRKGKSPARRVLKALATSPTSTGSTDIANTIGIVVVIAFAANAAAIFAPVITLTRCATRSAANSGNRTLCPSAQRYAIATLRPSA